MAKEMHSKQGKFQGFLEISWSFIYTYGHSKEEKGKWMWNVNDISCARDWTQAFFQRNAWNFDTSDLIAVDKQYVKSLFMFFFSILFWGVVRRGVHRGSLWTSL